MKLRGLVLSLCCIELLASGAPGGERGGRAVTAPRQVNTNDVYRPFLINSILNYYGNNGDGSYNRYNVTNEGFEFVKGSGKTCIFEDGVLWGGYHKGRTVAKVGGSYYRQGLQAGPILLPGTATTDPVADDPAKPINRIFRVRPGFNPHTPYSIVQPRIAAEETAYISRFESLSDQDIYNQYIADWNEWPAAQGAPFTYGRDLNNVQRISGPYDPRYDIPGEPGADQTLWYVANDCDSARVNDLSGSPIIGLEMQRTIWGYNRSGALGETIFMSTVLINKSGAPIDSMFMGQWADPDLGNNYDDFTGYDSTRGLGYVYNSEPVDLVFGSDVPAVGFDILQGPIVRGVLTDTSIFRSRRLAGYKNLPTSCFVPIIKSANSGFVDPLMGPGGERVWYLYMQGLYGYTGQPIIDPTTGQATKFCLTGDPIKQSGWCDGMGPAVGWDRRMLLAAGPFTMAAGDTQEMVVGVIAGLGPDYLSSITVLKSNDDVVQFFFNALAGSVPILSVSSPQSAAPRQAELLQNFPNPFNPSTTIRYALPQRTRVSLTVFNTLGQQVAILVDDDQWPGDHSVRFDGSGLASGVYFYRLMAGEYLATKRLVLVR